MTIYLPIAEIPVSMFTLLFLGIATGVLSGMFGVGGGFLMTPFLIFMGIPPAVAVASSANQIVGASVSGFSAHLRKGNVDIPMGLLLLLGGLVGSSVGVWIFSVLQKLGQIDLVISLAYVGFLGSIGGLMAWESTRAIRGISSSKRNANEDSKPSLWLRIKHALPLQYHFERSKVTVSAILPLLIGTLVGVMVSLMGVGGGFLMIPAMIYLLGMPTTVVIGTSLFQIMFITAHVTFLHALNTQSVDIILAGILLVGSVAGAQYGIRLGGRFAPEKLRAMLAAMVLAVAIKLAFGLFVTPSAIYTIELTP